jgi:ABC-type multidrug transport system ATPase subunit
MEKKRVTENDMPDVLRLEDLSKRYGQGAYIFEGLSHSFAPGTATGLVGPNGSGKTTLLRLLSVLSYPTRGRVCYGDLDVHAHPYRYLQHVGLVHDAAELPQYLNAVELLEYVLRARGSWDEAAALRVDQLFDRLMLDERREQLIGTYSSGMLKKVQIALALAVQPAVLLMDEPLRGLDEASTQHTLALLRGFKAGGGILIIASHLRAHLAALCDAFLVFPIGGAADAQHPVVEDRAHRA